MDSHKLINIEFDSIIALILKVGLIHMVQVGKDEFCTECMEWRAYDKEGKCVVCGKVLLKPKSEDKSKSYADYEHESFDSEDEE